MVTGNAVVHTHHFYRIDSPPSISLYLSLPFRLCYSFILAFQSSLLFRQAAIFSHIQFLSWVKLQEKHVWVITVSISFSWLLKTTPHLNLFFRLCSKKSFEMCRSIFHWYSLHLIICIFSCNHFFFYFWLKKFKLAVHYFLRKDEKTIVIYVHETFITYKTSNIYLNETALPGGQVCK